MDIQKQIEFEKFHARECNCDYDELKRRLDHQEKVMGHRYIPSSPRHEAWLVWNAAWQAKSKAVPEGFVLVPKEPCAYLIKHKLWNKESQPEIYLADDFIGDDGVEREKLIVCIPLYKGDDEAQEQSHD